MKNSTFLFIAVFVAGIIFANFLKSQDESPLNLNLDLNSRYIWRGTDFGSSPSIQPTFSFSNSGFTVGVWGAYTTNINFPAQEADVYLSYTFWKDMLSFTVTDYFFPTDGAENSYFKYNNTTTHIFETSLSFNGTDDLPISFLVGTMVYGNDKDRNGDNRFSTYCELSYSPDIKGIPFSVFCGLNLLASDDEDLNLPVPVNGLYGNDFGVVNLGVSATKNIKVTDSFEIPLSVSVITNPMKGNMFLIAGFLF